jgi:hypothetical protein
MDGIKIKELDVPTGQILGNPMLHSDFDGWVMLYKDFINQSKSSSSSSSSALMQNVLVANVTKGNTIDDRYYSPAEYAKLMNEQQERLHQAWAKRGYFKGTKDSKVLPSQATKKQNSEGNTYLRHLLTDCILPKSVTIFLVDTYTVIE